MDRQDILDEIIKKSHSLNKNNINSFLELYNDNIEWVTRYVKLHLDEWRYTNKVEIIKKIYFEELGKEPDWDKEIEYPAEDGLYLVGQTFINPFTLEPHFCLKVGKADNAKKRIAQYKTYTPNLWKIDFLQNAVEDERYYQIQLLLIAEKKYGATEWFEVSKPLYTFFCKEGFKAFEKI